MSSAAELGVGLIGAVILPVLKTSGAVDLEQRRSGALGHLGLELLLVGVGSGGHDLDLDALLLLVRLGVSFHPLSTSGLNWRK